MPSSPKRHGILCSFSYQKTSSKPQEEKRCDPGRTRCEDLPSFVSLLLALRVRPAVHLLPGAPRPVRGYQEEHGRSGHGGHDRLEDFYHAVEGGYYFMPPRPKN